MARSRSRKGGRDEPAPPPSKDGVTLDGEEHAWWAQREVEKPWSPPATTPAEPPEPDAPPPPPPRDVLAEHLGADWRITFDFDPSTPAPAYEEPSPDRAPAPPPPTAPEQPAAEPEPPPEPVDTSDPYQVLGLDETASWEEIVDCHRRLARDNHPDQLFGRSDEEVAAAEERMRAVNVAYKDLRVRRGK